MTWRTTLTQAGAVHRWLHAQRCSIPACCDKQTGRRGSLHTFEVLDAIQLRQQLVHNPVSDAGGVMAALWSQRVKLVKEDDAGRSRLGPPACMHADGRSDHYDCCPAACCDLVQPDLMCKLECAE